MLHDYVSWIWLTETIRVTRIVNEKNLYDFQYNNLAK